MKEVKQAQRNDYERVSVYFKLEDEEDIRFGHDVRDDEVNAFSYWGWLPLRVVGQKSDRWTSEREEHFAVDVGDRWITDALAFPGHERRISAAQCYREIQARLAVGIRYFTAPSDELLPGDGNGVVAGELAERMAEASRRVYESEVVHGELERSPEGLELELEVRGILMNGGHVVTPGKEALELCSRSIREFLQNRHGDLVEYVRQRALEEHRTLDELVTAAVRLGTFRRGPSRDANDDGTAPGVAKSGTGAAA